MIRWISFNNNLQNFNKLKVFFSTKKSTKSSTLIKNIIKFNPTLKPQKKTLTKKLLKAFYLTQKIFQKNLESSSIRPSRIMKRQETRSMILF